MKRLVLALMLVSAAFAQKPTATLPSGITCNPTYTSCSGTVMATTYSLPVGGTTWAAHNAAQFTTALNNSAPGDVIVLDAGVTYSGNFVLPGKTNASHKWIYITSSNYASLPAPGTRATAADAGNMPLIISPNTAPPLQQQANTNYWRLVGLNVTAHSSYPAGCGVAGQQNCMSYFLFAWPNFPPPTPLPDHIVVDRCYIHGAPNVDIQGAIPVVATNFALIDSTVSEIHNHGTDSSAISSNTSPGPIKIVNNDLEAAGENVIFGGGGGGWGGYVPSDIEIQNNYIFKPLSWIPLSQQSYQPQPDSMVVKNAIECKSCQRVLINNNTIQNVWYAGQLGYALVLTVRSSQSGNVAVVNDITAVNNRWFNVVSFVNSLGADDLCGTAQYPNCTSAGSQDNWTIYNNVVTHFDPTIPGGNRNICFNLSQGLNRPAGTTPPTLGYLRDITFQHNTCIANASTPNVFAGLYIGNAAGYTPAPHLTSNLWIQDNYLGKPITGDGGLNGGTALSTYLPWPNTAPNDITQRFYGNEQFCQGIANCASGTGVYAGFPVNNLQTNTSPTFDVNNVLVSPALTTTFGPPAAPFMTGWFGSISGPVVTTGSLPNGTVGTAYSQTLAAVGGTPPYTWSATGLTICPSLTNGLCLTASTGVISGTPVSAQVMSFTVTATDSMTVSSPGQPLTITVQPAAPNLGVKISGVVNIQGNVAIR